MKRNTFIKTSIAGLVTFTLPTILTRGQNPAQNPPRPDPLKPEFVKEFVGKSHSDLDRVKEMLENDHLLLHGSWDWGGGDFESGIEAAGHVGNKDIANYLLSKGARYNIYLACMLGHLDTVRQVLAFNPSLINSKGPHGFTMLHHANKGGEESAAVAEYLKSLGATETKINFYVKA